MDTLYSVKLWLGGLLYFCDGHFSVFCLPVSHKPVRAEHISAWHLNKIKLKLFAHSLCDSNSHHAVLMKNLLEVMETHPQSYLLWLSNVQEMLFIFFLRAIFWCEQEYLNIWKSGFPDKGEKTKMLKWPRYVFIAKE